MHHAVLRDPERRVAAWTYLGGLGADLALVQEAGHSPAEPDGAERRRAGPILAALASLGLVDLVRDARARGVLTQGDRAASLPCPCGESDCHHVKTYHQGRQQAGAMANNDYLFATPEMAKSLRSLEVRNGDADAAWAHSDHCPIVADFD